MVPTRFELFYRWAVFSPKVLIVLAYTLLFFSIHAIAQDDTEKNKNSSVVYKKRNEINERRFGEDDIREMIHRSLKFTHELSKKIIGQKRVAEIIQTRIHQYLSTVGTREQLEPVALHLMGLPGVGKSVILNSIEEIIGIPVVRFDMQELASKSDSDLLISEFIEKIELRKSAFPDQPLLVIIDELDKMPEKRSGTPENKEGSKENTHSFIGLFNEILSSGRISYGYRNLDVSDVMFVTAMNLSPEEISRFSKEILKGEKGKSFFDFTPEDFQRFSEWLVSEETGGGLGAIAKLLDKFFRFNTISRLISDAVIMDPSLPSDYRKITKQYIDRSIQRLTDPENGLFINQIKYSRKFLSFITGVSIYAPSGARYTVKQATALTETLANFGAMSTARGAAGTQDLPRDLYFDYNGENVVIRVTPYKIYRGDRVNQKSFEFEVTYDAGIKQFRLPDGVSIDAPAFRKTSQPKDKSPELTKKAIREARHPKKDPQVRGLAAKIGEVILGQKELSKVIEDEVSVYFAEGKKKRRTTPFKVLAGFPGIGKTELVTQTARILDIPLVRINLQEYGSNQIESANSLMSEFQSQVKEARKKSRNGKYIVLLEELDKIYEKDPKTGELIDRPVITIIKDLLNSGVAVSKRYSRPLDIRDAYGFVTMNFTVDRFGFQADPRMTSIGDVIKAYERLKGTLSDQKRVLDSMFLPDTVSRLLPFFNVIAPLKKHHYKKLIEITIKRVANERLVDPKTNENKTLVDVVTTSRYQKYLFSETVVPSEGARYTVKAVESRFLGDLELALKNLPKSQEFRGNPIQIEFDFDSSSKSVIARANARSPKTKKLYQGKKFKKELYQSEKVLTFPDLKEAGKMSRKRILTTLHEFGHAYTAVRMGTRFKYVQVTSPSQGIGGLVQLKDGELATARELFATLMSVIGSRAAERIFLSESPESKRATMDITQGPSSDIDYMTMMLWNFIYRYGFFPGKGVMQRNGTVGGMPFTSFESLPDEKVEQLGMILMDMEEYIIKDMLKAHSLEWYKEKIIRLAREGVMKEKDFYELIEYVFPGGGNEFLGTRSKIDDVFEEVIKKDIKKVSQAKKHKQSRTKTSPVENLDVALDHFVQRVEARLPESKLQKNEFSDFSPSPSGQGANCGRVFDFKSRGRGFTPPLGESFSFQ